MKKVCIINGLILLFLILVSCEHKFPFSLGDNYFLDHNGLHGIDVRSDEEEWFTNGDIGKINVDSTYIILCLKPIYKIHDSIHKINKNLNGPQQDDIIEQSKTKEYWIIKKKLNLY